MANSARSVIYILYNANANLIGKLDYAVKKFRASPENSPCSACDLTHGGLRLTETKDWTATKEKIPATVKQLHRDELSEELLTFVSQNGLKYPVVLGQPPSGAFQVLLTSEDLSEVSKDHTAFLSLLFNRAEEKNWKDQLVDPLVRQLPEWITPARVTLAALNAGLIACLLASVPMYRRWSLGFWALNRLLDCFDGSIARSRGAATELGGFLDLLGDFIVYSLLPIFIGIGQERLTAASIGWVAVATLEASFHINNFILFYIAAVASKRKDGELTSITMTPALVEGFEAGLCFTIMLIWPSMITLWSWLMSLAVAIGIVQRVRVLMPVLQRLDGAGRKASMKSQ
ncbi:hypothetical protein MMC26_004287 [Xylographa opegraphella]|nr:hypothetical protein [Xylographa opegraphella]